MKKLIYYSVLFLFSFCSCNMNHFSSKENIADLIGKDSVNPKESRSCNIYIPIRTQKEIDSVIIFYSNLASSIPYNSLYGTPYFKKKWYGLERDSIKFIKNLYFHFYNSHSNSFKLDYFESFPKQPKDSCCELGGDVSVNYLLFFYNDTMGYESVRFEITGLFPYDVKSLKKFDEDIDSKMQSHEGSILFSKGNGIYIYDLNCLDSLGTNQTITQSKNLDYHLNLFFNKKFASSENIYCYEPILIGTYWTSLRRFFKPYMK